MNASDLLPGILVKTPDGRIGQLRNFRLYESGDKAPGRAAVQFFDPVTKAFKLEGFSIADLTYVTTDPDFWKQRSI
jgi:hypothetical protein